MAAIVPHGGALLPRLAARPQPSQAAGVTLELCPLAYADLMMFAVGAYSPLCGFMGAAQRAAVAQTMCLPSGVLWPIPITLAISRAHFQGLRPGVRVGLSAPQTGETVGEMDIEELYQRDPAQEAALVFGTVDPAHPGVKNLLNSGPFCAAGPVHVFRTGPDRTTPALSCHETRAIFAERQWQRVVGFQTRNPIHRAHEYIIKCAMETADGLLLHPLVGATQADDVPATVRLRCYAALLATALPPERVVFSTLPAPMRYAGPREALLHALVRQNYGCTHFIVGRDHAGVGSYYGTYDAQKIFAKVPEASLKITPLFFEHTFYCRGCASMASEKTCPHQAADHITLSGTKVRELLRQGERPPREFSRPEVADILIEWARDAFQA